MVINGLDEIKTKRHTIEDHFIKCAIKRNVDSAKDDSKEQWSAGRTIETKNSSIVKHFPTLKNVFRSNPGP